MTDFNERNTDALFISRDDYPVPAKDRTIFVVIVSGECFLSSLDAVRSTVERALLPLGKFGVQMATVTMWNGDAKQFAATFGREDKDERTG